MNREVLMKWTPALVATLLLAGSARASQVEVFAAEDYADFARGEMDGVQLDADGVLRLGPKVDREAELVGPGLAMTRLSSGTVLLATPAPGRIWKLAGKKVTPFAEVKEPLVAALVPLDGGRVAAITGPKGGVRVFSAAGKEEAFIEAPEDTLLLDGAVLGGTLYVVGGGETGVLFRLPPRGKKLEPLAEVETKHLRSVAARKVRGRDVVVVGTDEEGFIYRWQDGRLRALYDAKPGEVIDLLIDAKGRIFAALVDASGRLSEGASSLAKESDEAEKKKKKGKKKEKKPRKVKSAEVLRLDPSGSVEVLWQTKKRGAYALAMRNGQLVVGTGPHGELFSLSPEGGERAGILGRAQGADEVVHLVPGAKGELLMSTAHAGSVQVLSARPAGRGTWLSEAWDAGSLTRLGRLDWVGSGGIKGSARTGQTEEPDETWSSFAPDLSRPGTPAAPLGRYVQVRLTLEGRASARLARLAHLVENRPPQVVLVDVVGPGWRVDANRSRDRESRSVTFGKTAFKKFRDYRGSLLPKVTEKGSGKQTFEAGWRTVYAYVEDADKDRLRYRFSLRQGVSGKLVEVKEWSDEPFVSFDASRLVDGIYQVQVEVDDLPSNGPLRVKRDQALSALFEIAHAPPRFEAARAERAGGGARLRFVVKARTPLSVVQCSLGGEEWLPIDPTDGILDSPEERFDLLVPGEARFGSASCLAVDEALNETRIDLPVR